MPFAGQNHVADRACGETSAVDERLRCDGSLLVGGRISSEDLIATSPLIQSLDLADGGQKGALASLVFKITLEVGHQAMAIDYTGGLALENAGPCQDIRFPSPALIKWDGTSWNADGLGVLVEPQAILPLLGRLSDDPLFGIAVWDRLGLAEIVHHMPALDAKLGLQGVNSIIQARVNDLT